MDLNWKRLLELNQDEVFGLDIGSSAVKMVQLRKDEAGWTVTAAGIVDIINATENDKNHKEMNAIKAIGDCLQSTGIQARLAVCGVCGPEVAVRYFKFPSLPPEEVDGAVMLEAKQVCPFNVDDGAVDYQLIPDGEDNVSGILVAATNRLIEGKRRLAKSVSLDSVLMDVEGLAFLNCFSELEKTKPGEAKAVLNVGSSYTTLAIVGDDSLPFIRDMAHAGNGIIEQIATERNVSTGAVREILSNCEDSSQLQSEFEDGFERACRRLTVDVSKTLRYYTAQEKTGVVNKIFVCGGFALVKGFVGLLDNQLPVAAVLWNPFEKISCDAGEQCGDILQKNGPVMTVAAGLAMRSI